MRVAALVSLLMCVVAWGWAPEATADDVDRLIRDAASGSHTVRLHALEALGNSGDLRALQPLLVALRDDDPTIRERAKTALQSLARTLQGLYQAVARWIETLIVTLGGDTAPKPPTVEKALDLRRL